MSKELYISATPHETRVAIAEDDQLTEVYYERENEYTLAGSVYKGRVTRVLPGMQSAFVDVGLERDAFLYVTDFLEEQEDQDEYVVTSAPVRAESEPRRQPSVAEPVEEEEEEEYPSVDSGRAGSERDGSGEEDEPESLAAESGREGAPAREDRSGVRRWRGRRGRRRGRGDFREQRPPASRQSEPAEGAVQDVRPVPPRVAEPASPEPRLRESREESSRYDAPVLPGESISKYRKSEPQPAQERRPVQPPAKPVSGFKPSTEVDVLLSRGWAGGNVLPGESISRYRRDASSTPAHGHEHAIEHAEPEPLNSAGVVSEDPVSETSPQHFEDHAEDHFEQARPEKARWYAEPEETEPLRAGKAAEAESPEPPAEPHGFSASLQTVAGREAPREESVVRPEVRVSESAGHESDPQPSKAADAAVLSEPASEIEHDEGNLSGQPPLEEAPAPASDLPAQVQHGVLEDEEIDEEEYEFSRFVTEHDAEFEEMEEEETLAAGGSEIGEAVRDAHLEERLRGTGETESDDGDEFAEAEDDESVGDESGEEYEGRVEVRAPAETAAFQQRPERQDRDHRFQRRRGGRRLRGGPGLARQSHTPPPTISELLKEGQEILVQIAKEPIAKKGARITSHIALPGRFLVFMPTVNHVGVSRKISSEEERQRLKRILLSEKGSAHGGFIVRTAAGGATEEDLRADLRFLINLWTEIRSRSDNSKSPALIYHDLNLVERILRDQVSTSFSTVWVDNEQEYERVVRFLNRFQPSLVRRVKLYTKDTPLFEQFNIQEEINKALKSKVWLRSGGYIVINQTEALVAIDVNTGKYVGKTTRLEDTIVRTNIDAIQEIVRQIRLRDLGGIIVIDFIDMDERRNRQKVMQALEEALKADRAPSKVLQFNDFGLVAITRKRVKQSLERTLGTQCNYCGGTGMVKSPATVCNEIYAEMKKMNRQLENRDVMLRVNPEVVKALKASNARWLTELEELVHRTIIVKSDPTLHQEQFDIH